MTEIAGQSVQTSPADGTAHWDVALPRAAASQLSKNRDKLRDAEANGRIDTGMGPPLGIFDALIVDEAQDILRTAFLRVLDLSVRGGLRKGTWHLFGDFKWQKMQGGDTVCLDDFCKDFKCPPSPLAVNCRNTPPVAELACSAGNVHPGYIEVLRLDDGGEPQFCFFSDDDAQRELLRQILGELDAVGYTGSDVKVLSIHKDERAIARTLTDKPWCDRLEPLLPDPSRWPGVNLRSDKTLYSSIQRFKGLEARAVVLTDIDDLSKSRNRSLFYVGATRATDKLVVLAHESLRDQLQ
jgi:superfamily I DNA/RNA helicase